MAVLEHLDGRALLCAMPTVSKLWLSMYKGALHRLDLSCANTPAKAQGAARWLLKHGKSLQEIRYAPETEYPEVPYGGAVGIVFSALVQLTQLQSLELSGMNLHSHTQPLTALRSLTSLSLPSCHLKDADLRPIATLLKLRRIDLESNSVKGTSKAFAAFSRRLTNMTSLSLRACDDFDPAGLSRLQQLQELDFSYMDEADLYDLPIMPSLTKLTFQENWAALDDADVTESLSNLQHLDLHGCYLGASGCALSNLVLLTRLEAIHGDDGSRCVLLTALGPLQQLRHLHLSSDFEQGDPVSSFSVLGTLQHLTHLELIGPQLPAGALAAVFAAQRRDSAVVCLPSLQYLLIAFDEESDEDWQAKGGSIRGAELEQLGRACPELQTLILDHPVEAGRHSPLSRLTRLTALTLKDVDAGKHGVHVMFCVMLMSYEKQLHACLVYYLWSSCGSYVCWCAPYTH